MKHRLINWALAIAAVMLFSGCAGIAHIEKDKTADFSSYKTFAWIEKADAKSGNKDKNEDETKVNDLTERNIQNAVNQELVKHGWREVSESPDILLNYELLVEKSQKDNQEAVYSRSYTRSYFNRYNGRIITFYYPSRFIGYDHFATTVKEATVSITMVEAKADKTVWQGWTTGELNGGMITTKEIERSVKAIFKKFDPGK